MTSIRRLQLCSLPRLKRMYDALSIEIERLEGAIVSLEKDCEEMVKDEGSVSLHESHGEYQLELERLESEIESCQRKIDDLLEKRETIQEVSQSKHLHNEQVRLIGSASKVKLKDSVIFLLILFVLSLLAIEVYRIGVSGQGAKIEVVVEDGKVSEIQILDGGEGYEAIEIEFPSPNPGTQAIAQAVLESGSLKKIQILRAGSGYRSDTIAKVEPSFSRSTLWGFWIADTLCCVIFMCNFIFEYRLADSKKWYWKRNWIDFITSIPLPPLHLIVVGSGSLNAIRAGRILRVVRILRAVRVLRMFLFLWRGMDHLSSIMDVKLLKRSLLYGLLAMFGGGVLFMTMERIQGGDGSFFESLWWSFTTLVTGGFADIHNPTTMGGKILTVMLVIGGMVLVGVFTATLTSVLVRDEDSGNKEDMDKQFRRLERLEEGLAKIDRRLDSIDRAVDSREDSDK